MSQLIKKVLDFWFTENLKCNLSQPAAPIPSSAFKLWFGSEPETDSLITQSFAEDLKALASDAHKRQLLMNESPEGAMAVLIIFDQFTRNIFRNQAEAFAYDHLALETAKLIRQHGWDLQMNPIYRGFAYLPFEHSESLNDQLTSLDLYKKLLDNVNESPELNQLYGQFAQQFFNYAVLHHDIIAKFGRYPHRNFILGRTSSPQEIDYLNSGAQTFGVTKTK